MVDVKQKEYCSGCTACASICPKKCITMTKDKLGFLYPVVDTGKCINCNLCVKVCPEYMETHRNNLTQQKAYAVIGTEDNSRLSSTSGGVFALIAQLLYSFHTGMRSVSCCKAYIG